MKHYDAYRAALVNLIWRSMPHGWTNSAPNNTPAHNDAYIYARATIVLPFRIWWSYAIHVWPWPNHVKFRKLRIRSRSWAMLVARPGAPCSRVLVYVRWICWTCGAGANSKKGRTWSRTLTNLSKTTTKERMNGVILINSVHHYSCSLRRCACAMGSLIKHYYCIAISCNTPLMHWHAWMG